MVVSETQDNMSHSTHADLVDEGHEVWVREAVRQHGSSLLRYATRLLAPRYCEHARDVVQDTFVKLCRAGRAEVDDHLVQWLFTVCRNRAFDVMRKEERMTTLSTIEAGSSGTADHVLDDARGRMKSSGAGEVGGDAIEKSETSSGVLQALEKLPRNQQDVIRLKFQGGLSYKDIAKATNLSVTNVGFLIHSGLKTLRGQFAHVQEARVMNESSPSTP